jgi:alkylated DNA repair protein (DNA oxidative demethylase)
MSPPDQALKGRQTSLLGDLFAPDLPRGFTFRPKSLDFSTQKALLAAIVEITGTAPLGKVLTKTGGYTSAAITNCGVAGWWSDAKGYRYETHNPVNKMPWPPMPDIFLSNLRDTMVATPWPDFTPDACLINFYEPGAKMGLHQDRDEKDFTQPIVTVCLGDDADFLVGGPKRADKATAIIVRSGDVMIMGGESRLYFHGVRKIYAGTSPIPEIKGRYSLTFRRAL